MSADLRQLEGLVRGEARRYERTGLAVGLALDDLEQIARVACWQATLDHRPGGMGLRGWARLRVRGALRDAAGLRRRHRVEWAELDPTALAEPGPSPEEVAELLERVRALRRAAERLDGADGRVARLLLDGWSAAEIAAKLGVSHETACRRTVSVHRVLACLLDGRRSGRRHATDSAADAVLAALEAGAATAAEISVAADLDLQVTRRALDDLEAEGRAFRTGQIRSGNRGRPAIHWSAAPTPTPTAASGRTES